MNSVGGVDRSTSNTNPGRGLTRQLHSQNAWEGSPVLLPAQVEGDLDRASGAGVGRVVESLAVAVEGIGGRHEAAQVEVAYELEGEVERAPLVPVDVLRAVGVAAPQVGLAVPQRCEVEGD